MRTKILIRLPDKRLKRIFDEKMAEFSFMFGSDVVYIVLWRYFNMKEDHKERQKEQAEQAAEQ